MISIKPFKAIRPTRDKANLVGTRSYVSYSDRDLDDKLNNNPFTFLHVINPKEGRNIPYGKKKYGLVKDAFSDFVKQDVLKQDTKECFYLYRQVKDANEYIGIIAAVSVKDYLENRILKHEKTLSSREQMFTDYLETTGFNAEPVLLSHNEDHNLNSIYVKYIKQRSEYEFTTTDRVLHQLWVIDDTGDCNQIVNCFGQQKALYIADGHHRCASSSLLYQRLDKNGASANEAAHFMAFLIGEEQMKVYDFNRLVKNETGKNTSGILKELKANFLVEPESGDFRPEKIHEIGMYIQGAWYKLVPKIGSFDANDAIGHLDPEILSRNVLDPVFGIKDLKSDSRVGFLPGESGVSELALKVDKGEYDVAFSLYPVTIDQIKRVSNEGLTMPPKSTYVEPKLRSGLTIYKIKD